MLYIPKKYHKKYIKTVTVPYIIKLNSRTLKMYDQSYEYSYKWFALLKTLKWMYSECVY